MAELKRKSPWDAPEVTPGPAPAPVDPAPPAMSVRAGAVRRINFDVPVDLHRKLRMKVASEGVTIADVGRRLLEQWLDGSIQA